MLWFPRAHDSCLGSSVEGTGFQKKSMGGGHLEERSKGDG